MNDYDITVIIPARNEEKTIVEVIENVKHSKNVKQVIVVNNASVDNTAKYAKKAGAEVVDCKQEGKGYAMEEGLHHAMNSIVVFLDADVNNYPSDLIEILTKPIIDDSADFVKSTFEREGGRVTELVAKPLLEILYPNMYRFSQPLSGMIAGKKEFFEKLSFENDYGVDIGISLDMIKLGARIEEVMIGKINNDSQDLTKLGKMSREVMKAIFKRAKIDKIGRD